MQGEESINTIITPAGTTLDKGPATIAALLDLGQIPTQLASYLSLRPNFRNMNAQTNHPAIVIKGMNHLNSSLR
jgi:hypothetical protein